jgi:predicted RNA-binding protein
MITRTLETGDYSLEGYEDILSIERKENIAELWTNYSERERFEDEMERMSRIKHAYIIIETSLSSDHLDLSPPQYKTRAPGKSLIRWLTNITAKNNVKMMFAGECGKQVAQLIMEEVVRLEKDRWIVHGSDE